MPVHSSVQASLPMRMHTLAHSSVNMHAYTYTQMHIYASTHSMNLCVDDRCFEACSVASAAAIIALIVTTLRVKFCPGTARYRNDILSFLLPSHSFFFQFSTAQVSKSHGCAGCPKCSQCQARRCNVPREYSRVDTRESISSDNPECYDPECAHWS